MEKTAYEHGVPSWVDIGTDLAVAPAFYAGLFGWDTPPGTEETGGYINATLRGKSVAGIGPAQNPGPPFWSTYFTVSDADAIPDKVTAAGGQVVVPPMDVMDLGRMAVFADPTGAFFSVWQAGAHIGAQLVNEPDTYCWSELVTTDVEGAKAFYGSVLGLGCKSSEGPMAYAEWKVDGQSVGGLMAKPDGMPAEIPPHWMVYFAVADLDASIAKVKELNGRIAMDPIDTPAGKFAPVLDPTGAAFAIMQLAGDH